MKTLLIFILAICWSAAHVTAEESLPTIRILPEDVVQASIKQVPSPLGTNKFTVRWTYTEPGAKKMLAFRRSHAGQQVLEQIGSFESRPIAGQQVLEQIGSFESRPIISTAKMPGWTEEGWLKSRTDKFFAVTEEDAKKIVAGFKSK